MEQWKSKSGKDKWRTEGNAAEQVQFCPGVGLDQLRRQYDEKRTKVCPKCYERKCICGSGQRHAAAALDALLQSAPAVAAASSLPLDDLLDTFAALSAARDKVRRAFNDCDSKLPGAAQDKAMEGRDLLIGDLES